MILLLPRKAVLEIIQSEDGDGIARLFDDKVIVDNHAVNGRSSLSFINEGRWKKVLDRIKPGDYVFIQFGHNDEKSMPDRHTDPGSTFDANLARYVNETRAKGGIPVLFNAVVRRCYYSAELKNDDDEKLRNKVYDGKEQINSDTLIDTHGAYVIAPRNVAKQLNVPFVDATKITHDIETGMGIEGSRKLHMWFMPGENPQVPKGKKDNTHYNVYGARVVAGALADAVAEQVPALKSHVCHYDYVVSAEGRGNFMDLQKAVDAVPVGKKAVIRILGGEWKKPIIAKGKKIKFVKSFGAKIK
ncbi:MAG: GDSL-type esterase/lipase family protein [Segatella copri]